MGLFKVDYTKEGPGIDKNAPPKRAFFRYFELLWAKRFKIFQGNILYFGFNLITLLIVFVILYYLSSFAFTLTGRDMSILEDPNMSDTFYRILLTISFIFTAVPIFALGPVRAGLNFLSKSYVKGEPVFTWTDFSTKMRSNRKLGFKVGLINGIIGFFLLLDSLVYLLMSYDTQGVFSKIPGIVLFMAALFIIFGFALFFMMNLFIYPMMVTFNITLKQLYKNAFIFAMIRWLPNLLILLLDAVVIILPLWFIPGQASFYVSILLYIALTPAFVDFTNTFYAYPLIKKFMIDNPLADKSGTNKEEKQFPDFVPTAGMQRYINGRYLDDEEYAEYLRHTEIADLDSEEDS